MSPFFKFQKKSKLQKRENINPIKVNVGKKTRIFFKALLILLLVGSVFLYLLQINSLATKGFKIQGLEGQISELSDANQKLSIEAVRLRSMAELNEKVQNLDMVPISDYSYIDATSTGVALR